MGTQAHPKILCKKGFPVCIDSMDSQMGILVFWIVESNFKTATLGVCKGGDPEIPNPIFKQTQIQNLCKFQKVKSIIQISISKIQISKTRKSQIQISKGSKIPNPNFK